MLVFALLIETRARAVDAAFVDVKRHPDIIKVPFPPIKIKLGLFAVVRVQFVKVTFVEKVLMPLAARAVIFVVCISKEHTPEEDV